MQLLFLSTPSTELAGIITIQQHLKQKNTPVLKLESSPGILTG